MRLFEGVLSAANVISLVLWAVPLRGIRLTRCAGFMAPMAAVVQFVVEGSRWQLIPMYTLSVALGSVWLRPVVRLGSRPWMRARRFAVAVGTLGLVFSVALPVLIPVFGFPRPSGQYDVGTVTLHWVDDHRPEIFSADVSDRRELMAQIWYPTHGDSASPHASWIQDSSTLAPQLAKQFHLPQFVFGHFQYVHSNAIPSAVVAQDEPAFPVLIFLHGFAGFRQHNTYQVEELVSRGYIVVGIDQPFAAVSVELPNGRQVIGLSRPAMSPLVRSSYAPVRTPPMLNGTPLPDGIVSYLAQDVTLALDRLTALNRSDPSGLLTGRMDLGNAGIFGPSLGGIVGAEACRVEPRLKACLVMDAPMPTRVVREGLRQATMWITRDAATMRDEGWPQQEIDEHQNTMRETFRHLHGDGYFIQVHGLFHLNLTDFPSVTPLMRTLDVTGPIDPQHAHRIINAYTSGFFDRYLKDRPTRLLEGPAATYPEVLFENRRATPSPAGGPADPIR